MYSKTFIFIVFFAGFNFSCNANQIDPMRPLGLLEKASVKIKGQIKQGIFLQSIIFNEDKGIDSSDIAVINGQVLKVGDKLNDVELIAIKRDSVVIKSPQGIKKLFLFSKVVVDNK